MASRGGRDTKRTDHPMRARDLVPPALALLGLAAAAASPSEPPPEAAGAPRTFTENVSVDYVLVPVTVRSKKGPVADLERGRFRLRVDGCEVAVESFEGGGDQPLGVLFLQDLSGSMGLAGRIESSRRALDFFLGRARPGDRFALATFSGRDLDLAVGTAGDPETIRRAMAGWRGWGVTAIFDAVSRLPELRAAAGAARTAAILLTDGAENASRAEPEAARVAARRADLPVYVLDLGAAASAAAAPAAALVRLAEGTGGRYYRAGAADDLDRAAAEVLRDLRAHYVLGFSTVDGGPVEARTVRLEIDRRGLWISHRRGYEGRAPRCVAVGEGVR